MKDVDRFGIVEVTYDGSFEEDIAHFLLYGGEFVVIVIGYD